MGSTFCNAIICIVTLLALVQVVVAFPCERIGLLSACTLIDNSPLDEMEKEELIASTIGDVVSWNSNFEAEDPPEGTRTLTNEHVSSAWLKILSITPSVFHESQLLSSGQGTLIVKYHYDEKEERKGTERGDCRTEYRYEYANEVRTYLNNQYIGSGEIVRFSTNDSMLHFRSVLTVITTITVRHYEWNYYEKRRSCEYDHTKTRQERTVIQDSLNVNRQVMPFNFSILVEDEYYGLTQLRLNATEYVNLRIWFKYDSFYEEKLFDLESYFTLEPYSILSFRSVPVLKVKHEGIRFVGKSIQVADIQNCQVLASDFFNTYTIPCQFQYEDFDLRVETDKEVYEFGENISVTVSPFVPVVLTYGDVNFTVNGSATIIADYSSQLITAKANGKTVTKIVHVVRPQLWQVSLGIFSFIAMLYVFTRWVMRRLEVLYEL